MNSGPLEEQAMLLTTEPSLQPPGILGADILSHLCWLCVFCSLVSVSLLGSEERMVAVCCLVENSSEILLVVATGDFSRMCL